MPHQSQTRSSFSSSFRVTRHIGSVIRQEGAAGLWRGVSLAVLGVGTCRSAGWEHNCIPLTTPLLALCSTRKGPVLSHLRRGCSLCTREWSRGLLEAPRGCYSCWRHLLHSISPHLCMSDKVDLLPGLRAMLTSALPLRHHLRHHLHHCPADDQDTLAAADPSPSTGRWAYTGKLHRHP